MKIAINATILDSTPSGLGVYAASLINAVAKLHEDILIYTSCTDNLNVPLTKVRGVPSLVQPARGRSGHAIRLTWLQTVLPLKLLCDQATVLFCPGAEGLLFPLIPQVMVIHDLHPLHFPRFWPQQYYYFKYIVPILLKQSEAIIAISESTRRDLQAFYRINPDRIDVIYPGYDEATYRPGNPSAVIEKYGLQSYLLYVGNMLPHKNLDRLLNAFAIVAKRFPHQLVIVGRKDPRYYPALERETKKLGLEKKVLFLDYLPVSDLPALYRGADALLLVSLYEGFGLPPLEAMACGTPVVAANIGSLPEVTGDSALLVDPLNVPAIADAIETVLKSSDIRTEMRQKGLKQAQRFSWKKTAVKTLEILHRVTANKKSI